MKQIIVPTDFSDNAFNALTCAIQYFTQEEVRFTIIHTFEKLQEYQPQKFNGKLDLLLEKVSHLDRTNHVFETCVLEGNFLTRLNEIVESENADLVVMGTQGRTADRTLSFGSNTLDVIKHVACPVLAIPPDMDFKTPERILLPSRLQVPFKERELDLLNDIATQHHSQIQLLHLAAQDNITKEEQEVRSLLESRFRESIIAYHHHNPQQSHIVVYNYINNFITKNQIDLLVIVNSRNSFLESFLQRPTIESLGLNLNIPFLIFQNTPR
jgi:nucleotide-binding universal stress UspA family protein